MKGDVKTIDEPIKVSMTKDEYWKKFDNKFNSFTLKSGFTIEVWSNPNWTGNTLKFEGPTKVTDVHANDGRRIGGISSFKITKNKK